MRYMCFDVYDVSQTNVLFPVLMTRPCSGRVYVLLRDDATRDRERVGWTHVFRNDAV